MKDPSRFLLILAAARVTRKELNDFSHWVLSLGPAEVDRTYRYFFEELRRIELYTKHDFSYRRHREYLSASEPISVSRSKVCEKVSAQLKEALDRPVREVVNRFGAELRKQDPSVDVPPYNKESLVSWLEKVERRTSAAVVRHVASVLIRSEGKSKSDWPLK